MAATKIGTYRQLMKSGVSSEKITDLYEAFEEIEEA